MKSIIKFIVFLILLGFGFLIGAHAQKHEAVVQPLTTEETMQAQSLYKQQAEIEKQIKDFKAGLAKKYIWEKVTKAQLAGGYIFYDGFQDKTGQHWSYKTGWIDDDFDYSVDYKYIVPAKKLTVVNNPCTCLYYSGTISSGALPLNGTTGCLPTSFTNTTN